MAGGFGLPTSFKSSGLEGTPRFFENSVQTDPGNDKLVLSFTVPFGKILTLHTLLLSCDVAGKMKVKMDGVIIGTRRVQAGNPDLIIPWHPGRPISQLVEITVEFNARASTPIADCEAFFMTTEK